MSNSDESVAPQTALSSMMATVESAPTVSQSVRIKMNITTFTKGGFKAERGFLITLFILLVYLLSAYLCCTWRMWQLWMEVNRIQRFNREITDGLFKNYDYVCLAEYKCELHVWRLIHSGHVQMYLAYIALLLDFCEGGPCASYS